LSRLLAAPAVAVAPRALSRPDPANDPFLAALLARTEAEAFARGKAAGAAEAHAAAAAAVGRAADGLRAAVAEGAAALRAAGVETCRETRDLALAIAGAVLGREPGDGGAALAARLRATLAELDDAPLVVTVPAPEAEVVAAALADEPGVEVRAGAALAPGEARVAGRWASADLTRRALLGALEELLDASV
jgi:flagellar biosynthesis/type III secretory pathway protein FliH